MTVMSQALALGKVISEADEYKQMKQAENNIRANEEASKLMSDYQMLQSSYQRMQMTGHQLTEEHINKLKRVEEQTIGNDLIKAFYDASAKFHQLVDEVNAKIQEGIAGSAPAPRRG